MANLRSLFFLLLLGTASAALALGIRNDMRRPAEAPTSAEIDAAASAQTLEIPEMPKYDPPPIERFAAALDRPLFNPDRRPAEDEPAATGIVEDQAPHRHLARDPACQFGKRCLAHRSRGNDTNTRLKGRTFSRLAAARNPSGQRGVRKGRRDRHA